ncbi:MAG TPA: DUF3108 domain-containing protein [Pyrinomonadaceae bacterium]
MRTLVFLSMALAMVVAVGAASPTATVATQGPAALRSKLPFEPSEELFYEAEFSRAILRKLDVADFKFSAGRTAFRSPDMEVDEPAPEAFIFKAEISSKGFFPRLFNLNFKERVESIVEPLSFTVQRTNIHDEQGKRVRMSEATFDRQKGKMSWTQQDPNNPSREPRQIITDFSGQLQDVLSAIYFIRTQPLQVGKSLEVFIGDGGRVYQVPIRIVEKKRMKTILGKVDVVRVDPDLFGPNRIVEKEKGQFSLWLTDDHRRIPVSGKLKTDYGTFDIKLKKVVYSPVH